MTKQTKKKVEKEVSEDLEAYTGNQLATSMAGATNFYAKKEAAIEMIKSGLLPESLAVPENLEDEDFRDKAIGAVIAVVEYGAELGITPWVALNGIHVVKGKVVMGIHMYMGLALKNKILVTVIRDYEKVRGVAKLKDGTTKKDAILDIETEIEIERYIDFLGTTRKFRYVKRRSELKAAELLSKENYKKYPAIMLRTRCITEGLRLYAADIYMGTYESSEIADIKDLEYTIDSEGAVTYQEENK